MKILVTGANGQVGFCLGQQLANYGWDYQCLTRKELDISNKSEVETAIAEYKPDVIINAAAYTAVDKAEVDEVTAYAINSEGPLHLASSAKNHGAILLHISTDYVFSGDGEGEYVETDITAPTNIYGASKLAGEMAIHSVLEQYIILRTAWVFGEHGNNFVKTMIQLGRNRDQFGVVSDQYGGPTYAGDIALVLLKIVSRIETKKSINWGVYHYSGSPHVSWYEFASEIFKAVQSSGIYEKKIPQLSPISTAEYPTAASRPSNSRLNCNKLKNEFSIELSDWKAALKNIEAYVV